MIARLANCRIDGQQSIEGSQRFRIKVRDQSGFGLTTSDGTGSQSHPFDHVRCRQQNPAFAERGDDRSRDRCSLVRHGRSFDCRQQRSTPILCGRSPHFEITE